MSQLLSKRRGLFLLTLFLLTLPFVVQATEQQFDCNSVTGIPVAECEALVTLYNNTSGESWFNDANWLETNAPCDWFGVDCDAGHVKGLRLYNNNLGGTIPVALSNLTELSNLGLHDNRLNGSIPPELGSLSKLGILGLPNNELSGPIPAELGNLHLLEALVLSGNLLSGPIPQELSGLWGIYGINLSDNQLSGSVPNLLGALSTLQELKIDHNLLAGSLPVEFTALGNLHTFWFDETSLCEPTGAIWQDWLAAIPSVRSTGVLCEAQSCLATFDDGATTYATVQEAVDNAPAGATVKVAGTCATVNSYGGEPQVVYLDKNLTIEGGHDLADWLAAPDPFSHPTALDANWHGRSVRVRDVAVELRYLTVQNGTAYTGGGILNEGALQLDNVIIYDNAANSGGGLYSDGGSVSMLLSEVSGNAATGYGGGVAGRDATITIDASTFADNVGSAGGGAIEAHDRPLVITNSLFEGNGGDRAGAIFSIAPTEISDTAFRNNTADWYGGAIVSYGDLSIESSTFSSNRAETNGATIAHMEGSGGIAGALTVTNSTFSNNESTNGSILYLGVSEPMVLQNVTIYENWVGSGSGSVQVAGPTAVQVSNSVIVAMNAWACVGVQPVSLGHNLDNDGSCVAAGVNGDLTVSNPLLGGLHDNGGPTLTHLPQPSSPVVDAGDCASGTTTTDQRGVGRPSGVACDIGAVEAQIPLCAATADNGATVFNNVQAAVDAAPDGGFVKVAGVCRHVNTVGGTPQIVYINKHVTIEGGHSPHDWSLPSNTTIYPTTLDAQWIGRAVRVTTGASARLRNMSLVHGSAATGGAIYSQGDLQLDYVSVNNNVANSAGGGVYNGGGTVIFDHVTVRENHAAGNGGGYYGVGGDLTIKESHFERNTVLDAGGAVFQTGGSLVSTNSDYEQNVGRTGGAHYLQGVTASYDLGSFYSNTATGADIRDFVGGGGAIMALGGVVEIGTVNFSHNHGCSGGAIFVQNGTLTIGPSQLQYNESLSEGGAVYALNSSLTVNGAWMTDNAAKTGGALFSSYTQATLNDTFMAGNDATRNGGAIHTVAGSLKFSGQLLSNSAPTGGAICNQEGAITLDETRLEANRANGGNGGGAIYTAGGTVAVAESLFLENIATGSLGGGAVHGNNGAITIDDSVLVGNSATHGGAVYNHGGQIAIAGEQMATNSADIGGALYNLFGAVTIDGVLVAGNSAELGGGVFTEGGTLAATGGIFDSNEAKSAGAIFAQNGEVEIERIAFFNNTATGGDTRMFDGGGGAILQDGGVVTIAESWLLGNEAISGGGVFIEKGTLLLRRSTLSLNSAETGGALHNTHGAATIINATLHENSADVGGGIANYNDATLTLKNASLLHHSGSATLWNAGTTYLHNSILAYGDSGECANLGTLVEDGFNLVMDGSCGMAVSGDPLVGPLGNHGGPTPTASLLLDSPAIDAGDCSGGSVSVDQRNYSRPYGDGCDIGAVEWRTFSNFLYLPFLGYQ